MSVHLPPGSDLMTNLLLGLSMLLVVFDDYKMRTRRLGVINALTTSITRAQQHGPMMVTALEELKGLMCAKAAWFRLLEGEQDGHRAADRAFPGLSARSQFGSTGMRL